MKNFVRICFALIFFLTIIHSAYSVQKRTRIGADKLFSVIDNKYSNNQNIENFSKLDLNSALANEFFSSNNELFIFDFPINKNVNVNLILIKKRPVIDANTKFLMGSDNEDMVVKSPEIITFSGFIEGEPGSNVNLFFINHKLFGLINKDEENYIIAPEVNSGNESEYIIASEDEFYRNQKFNINYFVNDFRDALKETEKHKSPITQSDELLELELALETDTEFFKLTGGNLEKAQTYSLALISLISTIYEEYVNITFYLKWLKCWTDNPSDPYNAAGNPYTLNDKAREYWKANYSDVDRDIYHVITADPSGAGQGGFGWFDALCGENGDYGFATSSIKGVYNLPTYAYTYDVQIIAHEIGHNFNASHTHSCAFGNIPLDTCMVTEAINGGCLDSNVQPKPNLGSIMSYCGGINNQVWGEYKTRLIFLPEVATVMRQTAEGASCLTQPVNSAIYLLNPKGRQVYQAGEIIEIKWTSTRVNSVNISYTDDGDIWKKIAKNINASDRNYLWKAPEICTNNIRIRISDDLNDDIADTSLMDFSVFVEDTNGMIAHYTLDSNTKNMVCGFSNAEPVGNLNYSDDRFGSQNCTGIFNGTNYLVSRDCNFNIPEFSVLYWFNTDSSSGVQTIVGTNWQEAAIFQSYIWWGRYGAALWIKGGFAPVQLWSDYVARNKWNHGAITFNGNQFKIFLNGELSNIIDTTSEINPYITSIYFGARREQENFFGKLDDIKIFNRALKDEEIQSIYEQVIDVKETKIKNENYDFSIYPNPACDILNIEFAGLKNKSLIVCDILGNKIIEFKNELIGSENLSVDISDLAQGLYFLRLQSQTRVIIKKFSIIR